MEHKVEIGQIVLARQKYSVPWPSRVIAIRKECVDVHFFGDGRTGPVKRNELSNLSDSTDIILKCIRQKTPNYLKGIIEMERFMNVPANKSITQFV